MGYSLYDVKVSVIMRSKGAFSWRLGDQNHGRPAAVRKQVGRGV